MRRVVAWVSGVLGVVVIGVVVQTMWVAGAFRGIEPHFDGRCRRIPGPPGPEDVTIHPTTGLAYISSYDRRGRNRGHPAAGAIFAYDLGDPAARPRNLTPDADASFQPHGVSLWPGTGRRGVLFVVNHPAPGTGRPAHTIEVFAVAGGGLVHRESLTDPQLVMPNDIVGVGPSRFYVTNTHGSPPGWRQTVETYLRLERANVLYYDGTAFRPALERLLYPNGINVSRDGTTLYIASTTGRRLLVFDRDPGTSALRPRTEVFVGSGLDNIEVDSQGSLWIGAHPKLLAVGPYMEDPERVSPSQVVHVIPQGSGFRVEEVYLDDGREISGSSVAAVWKNRMLIGQIAGEGFLDCVLTGPGG